MPRTAKTSASKDACVKIPVISGVTVKSKSHTLPSPGDLKDRYAPIAAEYVTAARTAATESVGPRIEAARDVAKEKVGEARHLIDDNLPQLTKAFHSAVDAGLAATEEAKHRSADAAEVLRGKATITHPRSRRLKRGVLTVLGVLAVAGGVAAWLARRQHQEEDPWARPLADPYVAPQSGRESTVPVPADTQEAGSSPAADETATTAEQAAASPDASQELESDEEATPEVAKGEVEVVDLTQDGMPQSPAPTDPAQESDQRPQE